MNPPDCTVRRANVDDLGGLKKLWERARLQVLDLERRLTEFQLIVRDTGDLIGAIGLHIDSRQGRLHSEAFAEPDAPEKYRSALLDRVQILARNHGLVRLWTADESPFWRQAGFSIATPETVQKLPASFGDAQGRWLTLQLKEDNAPVLSLDQEFELFQQAQRASTEQVMQQARNLRTVAYVVGFIVVFVAIGGGLYLTQRLNKERKRASDNPPAAQTNLVVITNGLTPAP
jgi:N-acetylglutamate synthase-like GNAT family acetyltransferase